MSDINMPEYELSLIKTQMKQITKLENEISTLSDKNQRLLSICADANSLFTEILPQAGKLVFQDYGLLNETLIALDKETN